MKFCPNCGYLPIRDEATQCPCCGGDVSEQVSYDYPNEETDPQSCADTEMHGKRERKCWKDQPLKMRLALVILGFVVIVGACITILCLV